MKDTSFWSKDLFDQIELAKQCKVLLSKPNLKKKVSDLIFEKIDNFISKAQNPEFQIAFVGTIKAGKSSLINALLHGQYASASVAPETAVLTKFGDSGIDGYYLDVEYYSVNEWDQIWKQIMSAEESTDEEIKDRVRPFIEEYHRLNASSVKEKCLGRKKEHLVFETDGGLSEAITKYTSSSSQIHYYIKEVFVGIKNSYLPKRVIICDTPGLDDVLEYRSNVTKRYINSADVVIVCVESSFLGGEQLHTIQSVFSLNRFHPERVYVVGTKIDKLKDPLEDWKVQKKEWIRYLKGSACYNSKELANKNLIGVSAWIEQILCSTLSMKKTTKDYYTLGQFACSFKIDPERMLEKENRRKLRKAACVMPLLNILKNRVFKVYKKTKEDELKNEYKLLAKEIIEKMQEIIAQYSKLKDNLQNESSQLHHDLLTEVNYQKASVEELREKFEKLSRELEAGESSISENIEQALRPFLG